MRTVNYTHYHGNNAYNLVFKKRHQGEMACRYKFLSCRGPLSFNNKLSVIEVVENMHFFFLKIFSLIESISSQAVKGKWPIAHFLFQFFFFFHNR